MSCLKQITFFRHCHFSKARRIFQFIAFQIKRFSKIEIWNSDLYSCWLFLFGRSWPSWLLLIVRFQSGRFWWTDAHLATWNLWSVFITFFSITSFDCRFHLSGWWCFLKYFNWTFLHFTRASLIAVSIRSWKSLLIGHAHSTIIRLSRNIIFCSTKRSLFQTDPKFLILMLVAVVASLGDKSLFVERTAIISALLRR